MREALDSSLRWNDGCRGKENAPSPLERAGVRAAGGRYNSFMPLSESDTRAKLIDPALHQRGWTEDLIRREESAGTVYVVAGQPRKQAHGWVDYTLRLPVSPGAQPVAVALIEAKAEHHPPAHGLEQAKAYASSKRLHVPFVYSSNGHQFVEFDSSTGLTGNPMPMGSFPSPADLRQRYEKLKGFSLDSEAAKPLLSPYTGGESQRRYYQDAAIRAALEKIAAGGVRALLTMATGSGKTFIAAHLLKKFADAGQLVRALFVCDRDELRTQGLGALQAVFGADAAAASTANPQLNARVVVATYQTLGVDRDEDDASFLTTHYPENYFSHIIIDEAHRSAWGKWSEVLTRNSNAVQIGLTATPREFEYQEDTPEAKEDRKVTADNLRYFGEPVYEYSIGQGIEDGYLAAMEVRKNDIFLNGYRESETVTGIQQADLEGKTLTDAVTGVEVGIAETRHRYEANSFEAYLMIPERVEEMCRSLFDYLLETGGPEQKTIIFCTRDSHAENVAIQMNNLYADWRNALGLPPVQDYAFKCTAASGGADYLPDFRGSSVHHFIATTVDLLTTGVDVPSVKNIVFFRYVNSPISFYQMVGRGTRLHPQTNKLMFRVYDYTDATRLFGEDFKTAFAPGKPEETGEDGPDETGNGEGGSDGTRAIVVEGVDVRISDAGAYIMTTNDDGQAVLVTLEEYKQRLSARLVADIPALDAFRTTWIDPEQRREMMGRLPDSGRAPAIVQNLTQMDDFDLYDVLAEVGYGQAPKTRVDRAGAFEYKNEDWLSAMPGPTAGTVRAIASQFARGGTDDLESPQIFSTPEVSAAGGLPALQEYGPPAQTVAETKRRMFAA